MSTPPHASELPAELLGEIFAQSLPDKPSARLDPLNAPMVLCQVCIFWRQVTLSEPRLWDTVIFPSGQDSESPIDIEKCQKFITTGGVQRWFDRSGPGHLLAFGEEASLRPRSSHLLPNFLPIVTKYARRLKHISVVLINPQHTEIFRRGFPVGIFDNLESVAISCPMEMSPSQLQAFSQLNTPFNTAPKLKHASLTLQIASPLKFIIPWSQLSSVEIKNVLNPLTVDQWETLFRICANLQYGTFVAPKKKSRKRGEPMEHQALSRLRFLVGGHGQRAIDWEILSRPVRFPNLRHLELEYTDARSKGSPRMLLKPFSRRPGLSTIQSLTFHAPADEPHHIPPDVERLVELLQLNVNESYKPLPSLTHITLPYLHSRLHDIAYMLRQRAPTVNHPGLTACVRVVLNGRREKYYQVLENMPEVASRYCLAGLTRAPGGEDNQNLELV